MKIINGNNIEILKTFPDNYFDAVVTDCPYGLGKEPDAAELMKDWIEHGYHEVKGSGFMGKEWDAFVPQPVFWREVFRVLKHGGHVLSFFGTRTYDWGVMSIRFAGFEVRDCIQWLYGSGFPKSHNISKALDKSFPRLGLFDKFSEHFKDKYENTKLDKKNLIKLFPHYKNNESIVAQFSNWSRGKNVPTVKDFNILKPLLNLSNDFKELIERVEAEREVIGSVNKARSTSGDFAMPTMGGDTIYKNIDITAPATESAKQWDGWGTALKPAHEDLVLARKPFQFSSDFVYLYENIVYNFKVQLCQSKLFVKDAQSLFLLSQKESKGAELDFAQWSVEKPFNTKEDLFAMMDMLQLELNINSNLNIVLSWLNTLADLWKVLNTYTTETESSTIIELRILNSLEWVSIFQNITLLKDKKIDGLSANVLTAESLFSVLNLKLNDILTHSAKESATLKEEEKGFVPNSEPIVLARKPLEKGLSIAENILKWGVGGINIDASRIGTEDKTQRTNNGVEWGNRKDEYCENREKEVFGSPLGRFPANIILTHHEDCVCNGTKKVKSDGHHSGKVPDKGGLYNLGLKPLEDKGNIHAENGMEEVEHWDCHEDCPIKLLDEQSGVTKSIKSKRGNGIGKGYHGSDNEFDTERGINDKGGASRFFYVAKASKSERNKGLDKERWFYDLELVFNKFSFTEQNLFIWEQEELNQNMDLNGEAQPKKDISEGIVLLAKDNECSTTSFGKEKMVLFPKAIKFTTSTRTKQIIELKTLNYYQHLNINDCIADVIETNKENGLNLAENVGMKNLLKLIFIKEKTGFPRGVKIVAKKTPHLISVKDVWQKSNIHSTVKPVKLMQYLVRMVTPPNGIVLDPFVGSGTTGIAAKLEGFDFVGIEQDAEYCKIAEARIAGWVEEKEPKQAKEQVNPETSEPEESSLIQGQLF